MWTEWLLSANELFLLHTLLWLCVKTFTSMIIISIKWKLFDVIFRDYFLLNERWRPNSWNLHRHSTKCSNIFKLLWARSLYVFFRSSFFSFIFLFVAFFHIYSYFFLLSTDIFFSWKKYHEFWWKKKTIVYIHVIKFHRFCVKNFVHLNSSLKRFLRKKCIRIYKNVISDPLKYQMTHSTKQSKHIKIEVKIINERIWNPKESKKMKERENKENFQFVLIQSIFRLRLLIDLIFLVFTFIKLEAVSTCIYSCWWHKLFKLYRCYAHKISLE